MDKADIDRLLELEAKATPGPWRGGHRCDNAIRAKVAGGRASIGEMYGVHDAALTAAARNLARPLAEQARRVPELEGDARTLRGYIATRGETPSMTASSRDHWKGRAEKAEAALAAAREENERLLTENVRLKARLHVRRSGIFADPALAKEPQPWQRCPSTHCERRGECASPHECIAKEPQP